jgi:hypothetical protein
MRRIKIIVQIDRLNHFSDLWVKYYSTFFKSENFIFLFEERFIETEVLKIYLSKFNLDTELITLIPLYDIPYDATERMNFMTPFMINFVSDILDGNTVVIYPDIDELLYHNNLIELLQTFETNFLVTNPIDIIQKIGEETEYNPQKKLFEQRTFCLNVDNPMGYWYKKNIIVKSKPDWQNGRHIVGETTTPNLYLIHLGKFDFEFIKKLNSENLNMYENQQINQNGIIGGDLHNWYENQVEDLVKIPEELLKKLQLLEI